MIQGVVIGLMRKYGWRGPRVLQSVKGSSISQRPRKRFRRKQREI